MKFYQYEIVWENPQSIYLESSQILIKRNITAVRLWIKENLQNKKIKSITRVSD